MINSCTGISSNLQNILYDEIKKKNIFYIIIY